MGGARRHDVLGYTARFAPLAILILFEAVRRIDSSQIEAAQNLGANAWHIGRTITLPLLAPAALATYALLWALSGGELSTSVLINQPGGQTLPVPIFNQMHIGSTAEVAALSLTLFALCGGALLLAAILLRFLLRHISLGR
jgi:iron(III) transport system permease protein